MGSVAIFQGNYAKFLKAQLNLNDQAYILTGSADPSAVATSGPPGSLYLRTVPVIDSASDTVPNGSALAPSNAGKYGNVFTAPVTGPVIEASFSVYKAAATTGNVYLKIYSVSGGLPVSVLYTSNPVDSNTLPGSAALVSFTFPTAPVLTATTQYALVFDFSGATAGAVGIGIANAIAGFAGVYNGPSGGTGDSFQTYPQPFGQHIRQYVAGSGSIYTKQDNGTSTAWELVFPSSGLVNDFLDSIKDAWSNSQYTYLTSNSFMSDKNTKIDASSTGSFVSGLDKFSMNSGQTFVSSANLSADFLAQLVDVAQVDLIATWDIASLDTAATYQVSRDGGVNYQTVPMSRIGTTDTYAATYTFTTESSYSTLASQVTFNTLQALYSPNQLGIAGKVVLASNTVLTTGSFTILKTGTPVGNVKIAIIRDSLGAPSNVATDTIAVSLPISLSSLATGINTFALPNVVAAAGTYWMAIIPDATYLATATSSANNISIQLQNGLPSTTTTGTLSSTGWSSASSIAPAYSVSGRVLDLRFKITAGTASRYLVGTGVMYGLNPGQTTSGVKNQYTATFDSVAGNLSTFTLPFQPDPTLLKVYLGSTGQVFVGSGSNPSFTVSGYNVIFPANTFNNAGISTLVSLFFDQTQGSSFDTSDQNGNLLGQNHLGSTDGTISKAVAGRGVILMRPDGTLREVAIDNNDNLFILSVP